MALTLVPFPASAPTAITDWEKAIDIMEFNTLGVQGASQFNFSSNTIKQGTRIMIGGSVYLADADTAITGTPSDYVKITPAGATASAAYVSSLTGVSWNSVWNFWEDGSGNAYLFNEMKNYAGGGSAPRSALAQHYLYGAYDKLTTLGNTILARDGGKVKTGNLSSYVGTLTVYSPDADQTTSNLSDAGSREGILAIVSGSAYGSGGSIVFGAKQSEIAGSIGFAAIKSLLSNGAGNTIGHLVFSTRETTGAASLSEVFRYTFNKNVLIGTTVDSGPRLVVADGVGSLPSIDSTSVLLLQNNNTTGTGVNMSMIAGTAGVCSIFAGDADSSTRGRLIYDNTDDSWNIYTAGGIAAKITSVNHILVNTTSDVATLHINGDARFTGTSAYWQFTGDGRQLQHSFAGRNYITSVTTGGSLGFVTNGRSATDANANLLLNSDQTSNFKKKLTIEEGGVQVDGTTGNTTVSSSGINIGNNLSTENAFLEIGAGRTGNGNSFIDLRGDATYTDYGIRLIRSAGPNSGGALLNRGTGAFLFSAAEGATWDFNNTVKWKQYYSATNVGGDVIYNNITSWVPSVGNVLSAHGHVSGDGIAIKPISIVAIRRESSTTIRLWGINMEDGTLYSRFLGPAYTANNPKIVIMSNFDFTTS